MKLIKILLSAVCFLSISASYGQINISELVQPSKIATPSENKLYFVDFWATWCTPCIHVSKYLTTLQEQYPNDLYIVSLTRENPDAVKTFLTKHSTDLAIAIDYQSEMFDAYNIESLPQGILFNARGDKLWEGRPADFKIYHLRRFLNQNDDTSALSDLFNIRKINTDVIEVEDAFVPTNNTEFVEIERTQQDAADVNFTASYIEVKGDLRNILAYALKVSREQIQIDDRLNKSYHAYFKRDSPSEKNMLKAITKALDLNYKSSKVEGSALVLDVEYANFWDQQQINWGFNGDKYLVDDSQIQADNVSFNSIKYKLASVLEIPVVSQGKYYDAKHDWQIHYKYFELMQTDLKENFGINAEVKATQYLVYKITGKAFN